MEHLRLLLLDDHPLFREGLARLLASEPDFEIVAQCSASAEALEVLGRRVVDIVLLDFDLGDEQGGRFISRAREAGYRGRIFMVTAGMSATESSLALKLGVSGIALKHNSPDALVRAIRLVASGETWLDQKVIQQMADRTLMETGMPFRPRLRSGRIRCSRACSKGLQIRRSRQE